MNAKRIATMGLCALSLGISCPKESNASGTIEFTATEVIRNDSFCSMKGIVSNDSKYHINSIVLEIYGRKSAIKDVRARSQQDIQINIVLGKDVKDCSGFLNRFVGMPDANIAECKIGSTSDVSDVPEGDCLDIVDRKINIRGDLQATAALLDRPYNEREAKKAAEAAPYVEEGNRAWDAFTTGCLKASPADRDHCRNSWDVTIATQYTLAINTGGLSDTKIEELRHRIKVVCDKLQPHTIEWATRGDGLQFCPLYN